MSRTLNAELAHEHEVEYFTPSMVERLADPDYNSKVNFLKGLVAKGTVQGGCRRAGASRRTVNLWLESDKLFRKAFDDAWEDFADTLEEEAVNRAREGSDQLLITMLKATRPAKFRENVRTELTGKDGDPIELDTDPKETLMRTLDLMAKRMEKAKENRQLTDGSVSVDHGERS